jgi:putative glutathione S-transferase
MFNSAFDGCGASVGDYYPEASQAEIDALNLRIYETLNNGVYKSGFATTQRAYEEAVFPLFETLDWLEDKLADTRYLTGASITEADWRLFTTLVRFDPVYVAHFKCNIRKISDYPNLSNYVRDLYQQPHVAQTLNMQHIKAHYFVSHPTINPAGVIPAGPDINLDLPHDRERLD